MKYCLILGTRPEIIKLSPILTALQKRKADFILIHTNQHNAANMDAVFFEELRLPAPNYNLETGSKTHGQQTGEMMGKIEPILLGEKPGVVIVQGDTNSVLAGGLVASKLRIPVAHVEAGLRSYDKTMPEEINRIVTDHLSDFLFCPGEKQKNILLEEGVSEESLYVVGNTIVDAVYRNRKLSRQHSKILEDNDLKPGEYILMTLHRPANVDNLETLSSILQGVGSTATSLHCPVVFPVHPRTKEKLDEFGLKIPQNVRMSDPVGFLDFLCLEKEAKLIITDSGGVQEEACILEKKCLTVRDNTERPETVEVGGNIVVGADGSRIKNGANELMNRAVKWSNPYGDGHSAEAILACLEKN